MKLHSYAKINLTLDILGKRKDDFHELETSFQQINLYDEVELEEIDSGIEIECNVKSISNESNLAYKAAKLLTLKKGISKGVKIKVYKRIPIGAGLSGGSSNAAAVLRGMNSLFNLGMNKEELISISSELGSDVAFHILGGTCLGKGRGEELEKIKDLEKHYVVLVYPGFSVSTKEAYSRLNYSLIGKEKSTEKFIETYDLRFLHNDFEYSVFEKHPELKQLKNLLGENAIMSGSGSTIFGLYEEKDSAETIYEMMASKYGKDNVFLAETINPKIELAKEMGFCFGVKRAIDEINKLAKVKKVYVLGKLIHNPQVIEELKKEGVDTIETTQDLENIDEGTIVISAHGVSDKIIAEIKEKRLDMVNLTCPLVQKVHDTAKESEKRKRKIIVYGDKEHTEVKGIIGNLENYKVIKEIDELDKEDLECSLTLVSQTTREMDKFEELADRLKKIGKDVEVKDTICIATKERQKSSIKLAKKSDIMIVIGGKISSNTGRLAEICSQFCETKHIETEKELNPEWFLGKERIGITAGASTPDWIIEKIKKKISEII